MKLPQVFVISTNSATSIGALGGISLDDAIETIRYTIVEPVLAENSPGVDAGTGTGVPLQDLEGTLRGYDGDDAGSLTGDGSEFDMGILERQEQATGIVVFESPALEAAVLAALQVINSSITLPIDAEEALLLEELEARSSEITSLRGLEYCRNLTHLDIFDNAIADLTPLLNLHGLLYLNAGLNNIADIAPLANAANLEYLDLGFGNPLEDDIEFDPFQTDTNQITDITPLEGLPELTYLNLGGNTGITGIESLEELENLEILWLASQPLTDRSPLFALENLNGLFLINCDVQNDDLDFIAGMTGLQYIGLLGNPELDDISALSTLNPMLAAIGYGPIGDISVLANWSNLVIAFLPSAEIADISVLEFLTNLGSVGIEGNLVTSLEPLANNTNIAGEDDIQARDNPLTQTTLCEDVPVIQARLDDAWRLEYDGYCMATHKQLTTVVDGVGDIQPFVGTQIYPNGTVVNLTAVPVAGGDAFSHWDSASPGSGANLTVTMDTDQTHTAHFVTPDHLFTIVVTGSGTTYPTPGVYGFLDGEPASVNAGTIAGSGYAFDEWVDATDATLTTTTWYGRTMTGDFTARAIFTEGGYTLTVAHTGDGEGYTNPEPGVHHFLAGRTAGLWGFPNNDNAWGGWSGDLISMRHSDQILMDGNKSVTAWFAESGFPLVVTVNGPGTTNPAPGTYNYVANATVPLSAQPTQAHWRFDNWSGDLTSTEANTEIMMGSARSVEAEFVPVTYTLNISKTGEGTVTPAVGDHTYAAGTVIPLTAVESDSGYLFSHWSNVPGQGSPTALEIEYTIYENTAITANFEESNDLTIWTYGLGDATATPGKRVGEAPIKYRAFNGDTLVVEAIPATGWQFQRWIGDINPEDAEEQTISLSMYTDRTIYAMFGETKTVTMAHTGLGETLPDTGVHTYPLGERVELEAINTVEGALFSHWDFGSGSDPVYENPNVFKIYANYEATAVFVTGNLLTTATTGQGTLHVLNATQSENDSNLYYALPDAVVTCIALPDPGYVFAGWLGDTTDTEAEIELEMDGAKSLTAVFHQEHTLHIEVVGGGTTSPAAGEHQFVDGTLVDVEALDVTPGHRFSHWELDATGTNPEQSILMDANKHVRAVYIVDRVLSVDWEGDGTATVTREGETTPETVATTYFLNEDEAVSVLATPSTGFDFIGWEGTQTGIEPELELIMDQDHGVTAHFVPVGAYESTPTGSVFAIELTLTWPESVDPMAMAFVLEIPTGWSFDTLESPQEISFPVQGANEAALEFYWQGEIPESPIELLLELNVPPNETGNKTLGYYAGYREEGGLHATALRERTLVPCPPLESCEDALPIEIPLRHESDQFPASIQKQMLPPFDEDCSCENSKQRYHDSDYNSADWSVGLSELIRLIQFYNSPGYHVPDPNTTEDGFAPGACEAVPPATCGCAHTADLNFDGVISLSDLLRVIQFYNVGSYTVAKESTEDGYVPGDSGVRRLEYTRQVTWLSEDLVEVQLTIDNENLEHCLQLPLRALIALEYYPEDWLLAEEQPEQSITSTYFVMVDAETTHPVTNLPAYAVYLVPEASSATNLDCNGLQDAAITGAPWVIKYRMVPPDAETDVHVDGNITYYMSYDSYTVTCPLIIAGPETTGDMIPPVLTLTGTETVTIACGTELPSGGVTAADAMDGDVTDRIEVTVWQAIDPEIYEDALIRTEIEGVGNYRLAYEATDLNGNPSETLWRDLTVIDSTDPVLTATWGSGEDAVPVINNSTILLACNEDIELHYQSIDACEGDISAEVEEILTPIAHVPGTQPVLVRSEDGANNDTYFIANVTILGPAPTMVLIGGDTIDIPCGGTYYEYGVKIVEADNSCVVDRAGLTTAVEIVGSVDTSTPGVYVLQYLGPPVEGLETIELERTVTVVDETAPELSLLPDAQGYTESIYLLQDTNGGTYTDPGFIATDNCSGDITAAVVVTGSVDLATVGAYTVEYSVEDAGGNTATRSRTVYVVSELPSDVDAQSLIIFISNGTGGILEGSAQHGGVFAAGVSVVGTTEWPKWQAREESCFTTECSTPGSGATGCADCAYNAISIVAVPAPGHVFLGWQGTNGSSVDETLRVEMSQRHLITATFAPTGTELEDLGPLDLVRDLARVLSIVMSDQSIDTFDGNGVTPNAYGPNGIPDAAELMILQRIIEDTSLEATAFAASSPMSIRKSWQKNLKAAREVFYSRPPYLANILAAYMTMANYGDINVARTLFQSYYQEMSTFHLRNFDVSNYAYFCKNCDMDQDGYSSEEEYQMAQQASQTSTLDYSFAVMPRVAVHDYWPSLISQIGACFQGYRKNRVGVFLA